MNSGEIFFTFLWTKTLLILLKIVNFFESVVDFCL